MRGKRQETRELFSLQANDLLQIFDSLKTKTIP